MELISAIIIYYFNYEKQKIKLYEKNGVVLVLNIPFYREKKKQKISGWLLLLRFLSYGTD